MSSRELPTQAGATSSLPNGAANQPYASTALSAFGGTAHYSFSLAPGTSLPPGLSLSGGTISGSPSAPGAFSFTLVATDSSTPTRLTASQQFTILISAGLTVTTSSLPNGAVNQPYASTVLSASGGTALVAHGAVDSDIPGAFGLQWILDYNGNGVWDGPTVDRAWFFGQNAVDRAWVFGGNTDSPVVGDWSGNGTTKIGLLRPGQLGLQWILDFNRNGQWDGPAIDRAWFFGQNSDRAVIGDWSGSGTTKIGVYRGGQLVINYEDNGDCDGGQVDRAFLWGQPADIPIVGRW